MMNDYEYLTVKQIVESKNYPFTFGQMRFFLTKRHRNRLSKAVRKIGRSLYLRKDLWESWIEEQQEKGGVR
jgi:hypothetical protein